MISKRRCRSKGLQYQQHIKTKIPMSYVTLVDGDLESYDHFWQKVNIECKNQEKLNIWKAIEQSMKDARGKRKDSWCVCFTRNYEKRDYIILDLDVFLEIVESKKEAT